MKSPLGVTTEGPGTEAGTLKVFSSSTSSSSFKDRLVGVQKKGKHKIENNLRPNTSGDDNIYIS